jgi:hypothetical protein
MAAGTSVSRTYGRSRMEGTAWWVRAATNARNVLMHRFDVDEPEGANPYLHLIIDSAQDSNCLVHEFVHEEWPPEVEPCATWRKCCRQCSGCLLRSSEVAVS